MVLTINGAEWLGSSTSELVKWCQMNDWCLSYHSRTVLIRKYFLLIWSPDRMKVGSEICVNQLEILTPQILKHTWSLVTSSQSFPHIHVRYMLMFSSYVCLSLPASHLSGSISHRMLFSCLLCLTFVYSQLWQYQLQHILLSSTIALSILTHTFWGLNFFLSILFYNFEPGWVS
jgi:hypothetical protein